MLTNMKLNLGQYIRVPHKKGKFSQVAPSSYYARQYGFTHSLKDARYKGCAGGGGTGGEGQNQQVFDGGQITLALQKDERGWCFENEEGDMQIEGWRVGVRVVIKEPGRGGCEG